MRNVPKLMRGDRDRRLRIHPDDAERLGIVDGEVVRIRSRVGAVDGEVRVTDELMPGVVSLPHGWSDGIENAPPRRRRARVAVPTATSWSTVVRWIRSRGWRG